MKQWEKYGYVDFIDFESDFLKEMTDSGKISDSDQKQVRVGIGPTADKDKKITASYIKFFKDVTGYTPKEFREKYAQNLKEAEKVLNRVSEIKNIKGPNRR